MEGGNDCETCKEFHQRFCCRHISQKGQVFAKIFDHDFSSSLALDKEVVAELNDTIQLKGPTGQPYKIRIDKRGESVLLKNGWKEFVCSHNLQSKDMLIFLYEGQSIFTVHICDKNGNVKSSRRGRDKEVEEQATHCKVEIPDSLDSSCDNENKREKKQATGALSSRNYATRRKDYKYKFIFISGREPVTDRQKENTLIRAKKFKSTNAYFIRTMLATSVYRNFCVVVPIEFCRKNLPTEKKFSLTCSASQQQEMECNLLIQRLLYWKQKTASIPLP